MTKLVLHGAPNTRAVRIALILEELGVPYEKKLVDLSKGEHKTPAYLALNPNGKVPTLVVDGAPMFESLAIFHWLADRFGVEKGLWPKLDDPDRRTVLSWTVWETATLAMDITRMIYASDPRLPKEQHNEPSAKAARTEIDKHVALLDDRLKGKAYLLGDRFSLADGWMAFTVVFLGRVGIDVSAQANVKRWFDAVTARPAFAKSLQPW